MQKHYMKQFRMSATDLATSIRKVLIPFAIGCTLLVLPVALFPSAVSAESKTSHADSQYAVLSFKVLDPKAGPGGGMRHSQGRLDLPNATLRSLISLAFDVQDEQIAGAPAWADSSRFDITLKSDDSPFGTLAGEYEDRRRVQMLLADRFGLSFHWEERELEAFALLVGDNGPRFKESVIKDGSWLGVGLMSGYLVGRGAPMIRVADALSRELGRTVLDCTELEGIYDLNARWVSKTGKRFHWIYGGSKSAPSSAPPEPGNLSIEEALPAQLGLILELRKIPAVTIVVDNVKQPSRT